MSESTNSSFSHRKLKNAPKPAAAVNFCENQGNFTEPGCLTMEQGEMPVSPGAANEPGPRFLTMEMPAELNSGFA